MAVQVKDSLILPFGTISQIIPNINVYLPKQEITTHSGFVCQIFQIYARYFVICGAQFGVCVSKDLSGMVSLDKVCDYSAVRV